jgi:putative redox protein
MDLQMNFDCLRTQPVPFCDGCVVVAETRNNPHQQLILAGRHTLLADRSALEGGYDTGPDPLSLFMMALGSQISMALRANADQRGWTLEQIVVHFDNPRLVPDDQRTFDSHRRNRRIACSIELVGDLYDWQRSRLIAIANRQLAAWSSLITMRPADEASDCAA